MKQRIGTDRTSWLLCLFIVFGACFQVEAGTIKVYPDRSVAALNEAFRLSFEADESVDGDPDFSPLESDFEIVGRSQRSSISIVNGSVHKSKVWILNLIAKRVGTITIPKISFGSSSSHAETIEVTATPSQSAGNANEQIFLEIEVGPRDPYVQQQVLYTVRLYRDHELELSDASLGEPKLSNGGSAIVQQLGKDRIFRTQKNDAQLLVVERTYALFPQQSGAAEIEPLTFQAQIIRGTASLFDPFAQSVETKRLQTERVSLNVKAIPKTFTGKQWLPAKDLRLTEIWSADPPKFKVDEPITRTRSLVATGLTAGQLPELAGSGLGEFKSYPDRPGLDDQKKSTGVAGIREEKVVLIAPHSGEYVLPALAIPWWNTETDREELAQLPERRFSVAKVAGKPAEEQADNSLPATATPSVVPDDHGPATNSASPPAPVSAWAWRVISLMLALGWLVTAFAWWRSQRSPAQRMNEQLKIVRDLTVKQSLQAVFVAAKANDPLATKDALLQWAKIRWPEHPSTSLGSVSEHCDAELAKQIQLLNAVLYRRADAGASWSGGEALINALKSYLKQAQEMTPAPSVLESLYKSSGST